MLSRQEQRDLYGREKVDNFKIVFSYALIERENDQARYYRFLKAGSRGISCDHHHWSQAKREDYARQRIV